MPDMPSNLTELKNMLNPPGAWVWLLTITPPDADSGDIFHFVSNTEDVVYGGTTYTAFNFTIDSFSFDAEGSFPELQMRVTNIGYFLQNSVREYDGLIGGTVSFVQVNTDYLEEDYEDDETILTIIGCVNSWPDLSLELGIPAALRQRVPESRFNPHICPHKFKSCRCGYDGELMTCSRIPSDCSIRGQFPANYGGPLSLRRNAVRYA
jgi:phage-related protein